jgi:hypothetical protein
MAFLKGKSGNPNGRTQGTLNKTTKETKEMLKAILEKHLTEIQAEQELSTQDRIALIRTILPYTNPKLQSIVVHEGDKFSAFKSIDINIIHPNEDK